MTDSVSIGLIVFVLALGLIQAYDAYRRDRRRGALIVGVAVVLGVAAGSADMFAREEAHTTLLGLLSGRLNNYETANDQNVSEVKLEAVQLKVEIADLRDIAAKASDELAKLDVERLRQAYPIEERWERDRAKGQAISGTLSWPTRYGFAVGNDRAGIQRLSVRYRSIADPFAPIGSPERIIKTFDVYTTYGLARQTGERYTLTFRSERVPYGPILEVDRPTNFPASAHVTIVLDGETSGIENTDMAFLPDPANRH